VKLLLYAYVYIPPVSAGAVVGPEHLIKRKVGALKEQHPHMYNHTYIRSERDAPEIVEEAPPVAVRAVVGSEDLERRRRCFKK